MGDSSIINVFYNLKDMSADLSVIYTVHGNGELAVRQELFPCTGSMAPMLPRFGMKLITPPGFENINYYGRGPFENYQDRNTASMVGIYKQTVKEQFTPYVRPQETGNKTDISWYELLNAQNKGIRVTGNGLLSITALHFFQEDLDDGDEKHQRHAGELKPRKQTQLSIDHKQMGVGSVTSWGDLPLKPYLLPFQKYSYSFVITPVNL
jgi:beta-galactosidase